MIKHISIKLRISNNSMEEARIIHDSLKPDNLSTPPMEISSRVYNNILEVIINNIQGSETAIATILDLLNSYELSKHVLEKVRNLD